jgi:hypothetical protein
MVAISSSQAAVTPNVTAPVPASGLANSRVQQDVAPDNVPTLLWRYSSPDERQALLARVPNPQPGPAPLTREQMNGLPLGSLNNGAVDGFWIGESGNGVRRAYDPGLTPMGAVRAIRPDAGFARTGGSVIFVNGLNNDPAAAANAGQLIANKTGGDVRVFYNATQGPNDVPRAVGDNLNWLGISRTPAARQLASTIATSAANGNSLHIMSTSHGSILTRNALYIAREQLLEQNGYRNIALPGLEYSLNPQAYQQQVQANSRAVAETYRQLSNIKIETFGAAAARWDIGGPQYVHWVNENDRVAALSGINFQGLAPRVDNIEAGANAVIVRFTEGPTDLVGGLTTSHSLETYMPKRINFGSFDQVRERFAPTNGGINIVDIPQ